MHGFPVRTASQCIQRWNHLVNDTINMENWSAGYDKRLIIAIQNSPHRKWQVIADKMIDRTDIQVRYRLRVIGNDLVLRGILSRD